MSTCVPLVTLTPRHQQELQMPIAIPAQPSPRYTPRASDTDGDADAQTVPQPPASPLERRGRLATEYQDVEESSRPSVDDTDQSTSSVPFPRQSSPLGGQQANPKPSTPASHPARLRRVSFRESIDLHSITPLNSMDEARSPQPSDAATQCHCCASHAQQTQAQAPPHSQGKAAPSIAVSESGNEADDEPDDLESAADTSREVIQKLVNDCNVNVLMPAFAPSSDDEDLHARAARKAARGRRRASPNATPKRRKEDKRNAIANAPTPRSQRKIESVYSAYLLADGTVTRKGKGFEGVGPSIVEKPGTLFQLPSLRRQTSLASASLRGRALKDVAEAQRLAVESSYEGSSSGAMPKHGPPTTPSNSTLWKKLRGFGAARLPKEMQRTV